VTIESLRSLATLLAADPLSVDDVAEALGTEERSSAGDVQVAPFDAAFAEATVVRGAGGDVPAHATVSLAEPTSLDELVAAFGRPSTVAAEEKVPAQALFPLDTPGTPYRITLIASLAERGEVRRLTLRRDAR
jgi:hypothetical protein